MKVLEFQHRQRGVVLIVALLVLMLMSLLAAVSMRSASSAEEVANQSRLRTLALQAAEAALAHCEREVRANAVDASKGFAPQAAAVGVKFDWEVISNWDAVPAAGMVKTVAFAAAGDAPGTAYFRRPPECMAQYLSPASSKSFVTTARGFGPDVAAKTNKLPDGAEVWLQSIVTPGDEVDIRNTGKSDYFKRPGAAIVPGGIANTLADVALKYWVTDLRPDLPNIASAGGPSDPPFWQNMTSYLVSFGAPGYMTDATVAQAKNGKVDWSVAVPDTITTIDNMRHAAHNGGGDFLTVTDAEQFSTQIGRVIGKMASQKVSQAGVAGSDAILKDGSRKSVPLYFSGNWWGNLEFQELNASGNFKRTLWRVVEVEDGNPTGVTRLPAPADRKIAVWTDGKQGAIDFTHANVASSMNALTGVNTNIQMRSGVSKDVIEFLRGERSQEGGLFRRRLAVLGDIVNSTPVHVKNVFEDPKYEKLPAGSAGLDTYGAYIAAKKERKEGAIFVGANDGMLHVFREGKDADAVGGGSEIFAYIPRSVLGKLERLTDPNYMNAHTFTVDGPLTELDAYVAIGKQRPAWRNLVIGATGAGAKAVFALDATDPLHVSKESVLWEINPDPQFPVVANNASNAFQELGHVLSKVESGVTASGHWVSVFGNGYDSKSGRASLFLVDSGTGALLKEIRTDTRTSNGLGGVRLVLNGKRQIIGAYAGDLQGRLWKFDLTGQPLEWALANNGKPLFTAVAEKGGEPLPITAAPFASERSAPGYPESYMVSFTTGKLLEAADTFTTTPIQAAFGLWDRKPFGASGTDDFTDSQLERIKIVDKTAAVTNPDRASGERSYGTAFANPNTNEIDWSSMRGWRMAFDAEPGMRGYRPVTAKDSFILVQAVVPPKQEAGCESTQGKGIALTLNPMTGLCSAGVIFDTNGDKNFDAKDDASVCGFDTPSDGIGFIMNVVSATGQSIGYSYQWGDGGKSGRKPGGGDGGDPSQCTDPAYAAAHESTCAGCTNSSYRSNHPGACVIGRSWRQIYPRGR